MFVADFEHKRARVEQLLQELPEMPPGNLDHVVHRILQRREDLLALAARHETPCYVFDADSFLEGLTTFRQTFDAAIPRHQSFYAVKSNHHPFVVRAAVQAGVGLDVSSRRELELALRAGAGRILFSGPAKSAADLELAVQHAERTIVNLDSQRELRLLGEVTARAGRRMRAGVRIHTAQHGKWSKFGIPLADLPAFWRAANAYPGIELQGLQSHLSWTRDAGPYCRVIEDVARCLRDEFSAAERAAVRFYDFGGGYRPYRLEGRYPTEIALGEVIKVVDEHFGEESRFAASFYLQDAVPLEVYAREVAVALATHLEPLVSCEFFSEPGRIVSSLAMHLLFRVADRKRDDLVIVDGGIHMVGWERYLHVYVPVVNLSRPALREIPVRICGSLCDPEDVLGQSCYAEAMAEGDVLVMPYQGAYTFSTAQNFIRDIPRVRRLPARLPPATKAAGEQK